MKEINGSITYLTSRYFDETYSEWEIGEMLERYFPEEYKLWSRELAGGNNGVHKIKINEFS